MIGRESATYRRGTRSVTDHCIFHRQILFETEQPTSTHTYGRLEVAIPEDSMHSFDGGNNKISWHILIEGDVPRWPNIKAEYPFTVRPQKIS